MLPSSASGSAGSPSSHTSIPGAWCSSTRPGSRPTWRRSAAGAPRAGGCAATPLRGYAPHGHWRTLTFVAALRSDGIVAPCVFDGPINGVSFRAWVDQQLLEVIGPGAIVVMDNLGSHKSIVVRRAIRARGARLWYLPAYSPDLNPIEQAFSKIKHWMRMAQRRSIDDTWRQIGQLVQTIQPAQCQNYIANAGYGAT
jgi:transposase